jgi:PAS domain S-box-containing protein
MQTNTAVFRSAMSTRNAWWKPLAALGPLAVVACGYYVGCLAGFALLFPGSGISFFWPPTAVLTAALLLNAPRSWTGILVAAFVAHAIAHAQRGVPTAASPILFFGNASQAVLAAAIVQPFLRGSSLFANSRNVTAFVIGACALAPALASVVPAYAYVRLGWAADFAQAWRDRAISNAVAMLTVVPSCIALWHVLSERRRTTPGRLLEYALLLLGVVAVQLATARIGGADILGLSVALYAPAPFLVWATVRFGGSGLSFALVWTTLLTIFAASATQGSVGGASPADTVIGVQLLIAANAIPMMFIAGLLEQTRAEHAALVGVEQQNRAILHALPDSLYVLTRDGLPITPSDRAADILPSELADSIGGLMRVATRDTPVVTEFTRTVDLDVRRYEARFVALDDDRVLSVVRDITDRWRAENALREVQQRYALATAAGGIGIWEIDVATGEVRIEGNLRAALGYPEEQLGHQLEDWIRVIHEMDRDEVEARLAALNTGERTSFEVEFRFMRNDASALWVSSKGAVMETANGQPKTIMGTYADITERKEAALALAEAHDALIRTGRIVAVAEFSASIAHELQQPLTAIAINAKSCLRFLDMPGSSAEVRAALHDVVSDSVRASEIVNRTQEMFTNHPMRKTAISLNDAVRYILNMATGRLDQAGIRVELLLHNRLPPVVADAVQVHQILLNLIVNAIDAMSDIADDLRVLRISTRRGRDVAIVSVRDHGRGFAVNEARRVFEAFYTTKSTGIGMGLAISRSIVVNHGGRLWAVSNVDGGATFRFTLPLLAAHQAGEGRAPSRRVLIVDDHREMRRAVTRLLRTRGHHIAVADSGLRALAAADTFQPDAAIVDMSLHDMSGLEVGRRLRQTFPADRLQLIALTAHQDDDVRQACFAAGFDAYLVKPEDIHELERLLTPVS